MHRVWALLQPPPQTQQQQTHPLHTSAAGVQQQRQVLRLLRVQLQFAQWKMTRHRVPSLRASAQLQAAPHSRLATLCRT
jgi:hypothetical protein